MLAVLYSGRSKLGQSMLTFRFLYVFRFFRFLRKFDFWSLFRNVIFTGSCTAIWGAVGGGDFDLILKIKRKKNAEKSQN